MVGQDTRRILLKDILSEKQLAHIIKQSIGENVTWELRGSDLKPATDGLAGFLGDHMKASLQVYSDGELKNINIFIKCLPIWNKPKAEFIDKNNYFRREKLMFEIFEQIRKDNDPNPFCPKAYLYTETIIVMPDITFEGYTTQPFLKTLDLQHLVVSVASIARFHAAFTNYETKKTIGVKRPLNFCKEYGALLDDPTFCDTPWLKATAKLSANIIKAFSSKPYRNMPDLEAKFVKMYLVACGSVTYRKETVNVLVHKDLWVNNVMFKHDNGKPTNAVIVDFQLIRYVPPAFDLMTFIYLTTSRSFRDAYEQSICDHYYSVFCDNLDEDSKRRMVEVGYDRKSFLYWCEQARMFGLLEPASIHPFILMHPKHAQRVFDDPDTYDRYINEDRTEPVLEYAATCREYRDRCLEVTEEFLERYILQPL